MKRRAERPLAGDDPAAYEDFYRRNVERVTMFFARRTDAQTAWDLTAETFAVALDKRHHFRGSTADEATGWLFAIARSQLSHHVRHASVEHRTMARLGLERIALSPVDTERIEELVDAGRRRLLISESLGALPANQAEAVRQRILLERDYATIAAELRTSEQAVRTLVSRGLRALRLHLGDLDGVAVEP